MSNFYKLNGLFIALVFAVLVLINPFLSDVKEDLEITKHQISGVEFIEAMQSVTIEIEAYQILIQLKESKHFNKIENDIETAKETLDKKLLRLKKIAVLYPQYKAVRLIETVEKVEALFQKKEKLSTRDFNYLDSVMKYLNKESFSIGDISSLHYEGEKEIYLFASIMTHYMPEFTGELSKARLLLIQGIVEKKFNVNRRNNIVHSISLFSLSKDEIEQIVQLIADEFGSGSLEKLLKQVDIHISDIKNISDLISKDKDIRIDAYAFYELTKGLSQLSINLHNENIRLLSETLNLREKMIKIKISNIKFLFILIVFIAFLAVLLAYSNTRSATGKEKSVSNLLKQTQDAINAFSLVCKMDKEGLIKSVNTRFCEVSGYTEKGLIGSSYEMIRHPDMSKSFFEQMWLSIEDKRVWTGKVKNLDKRGEPFYLDMQINAILDPDGDILEYISISSDITELELIKDQLESDLNRSNEDLYRAYNNVQDQKKLLEDQKELYELVFKNTSSSVLIIDIEENRFIDCNEPAVKILECDSKDEVLNLKPADLSPEFQPDGRRSDEKSDEMNKIAVDKGSHTFEWKHLSKKGKEFWVEVILTPIILEKKQVLYVVWRDIGEIKQAMRKREEQQMVLVQQARFASMGEMIGNISHQWRQPLNALGLILQKLRLYEERGKLSGDVLPTSIDKSMKLINSMSSTIDDFRDFFNPNKEKSEFLILEAIEKAYAIVDSSFEHALIKYTLEAEDENLEIEGYMNEFSQVIVNLLNNSKDALIAQKIDSAYVSIKVYKDKDRILIRICDNAGGIPLSVAANIFDPYFTTKEEGKGTGIGLYMSKMIIEDHMKGTLDFINTSDGACFRIGFTCD